MNSRVLLALLAALLCTSSDLAFADIMVSSVSRTVVVGATHGMGSIGDSDTSGATGTFSESASVVGTGPAGVLSPAASQTSTTPTPTGPSITGTGLSSLLTASGDFMTGYSESAMSDFDVSFTVSVDGLYLFDATVTWTDSFSILSGVSFVDLSKTNLLTESLAHIERFNGPGNEGTASMTVPVSLFAANTYRLRALATLSAGGLASINSATATWTVNVTAIPEASAVLLLGVTAAAGVGVKCTRRSCVGRASSRMGKWG